jgi:hypothetical protein
MSRNPRRSVIALATTLTCVSGLVAPGVASAAAPLHVSTHLWEVGEANNVHSVASGATFEYCAAEPATGLTPVIAYSHAPVGKSFTFTLAAPAATGTVVGKVKVKFKKASGRVDDTFAEPSFPKHQIAGGKYTFSMIVSGKTVASETLTLDPTESKCAG